MRRLIVGISGASGVILGYYMLQALRRAADLEVHLVITEGGERTIELETALSLAQFRALADVNHHNRNMAAAIASGSFPTDGMIVIPASMKSISGIAHGFAENLLLRAADVCLKEGRKVVVVPREMPLSRIHLKNITACADYGCVIIPPMLTFYGGADSVEKQVNHIIGKILRQFSIAFDDLVVWQGAEAK